MEVENLQKIGPKITIFEARNRGSFVQGKKGIILTDKWLYIYSINTRQDIISKTSEYLNLNCGFSEILIKGIISSISFERKNNFNLFYDDERVIKELLIRAFSYDGEKFDLYRNFQVCLGQKKIGTIQNIVSDNILNDYQEN